MKSPLSHSTHPIGHALSNIRQRIIMAAQQFNRDPNEITLLAVSKTHPVETIQIAIEHQQKCFGENYLQEAIPKIQHFAQQEIEWHFIGSIQSNKTRLISENFDWVQSLDSLKHAQRLNEQRPIELPPLNVCIQVNISQEPQKSGITLDELPEFAQELLNFPHLRLRGLMALPIWEETFEQQRLPFRALHQAYQTLQQQGFNFDTLSMGMTDDFEAAIAEGATMIRIGTAIFGERQVKSSLEQ